MLTIRQIYLENKTRWLWLFLSLLPFIAIPVLGSLFYFRHDDSMILLWAKEFTKPFYLAFSSDPGVNEYFKYSGMGSYWRPCVYLYVKALWHVFGANPTPFFVIGGGVFMAAVFFLFRIGESISGPKLAFLSCLFLFATFHSMMYNLFHVGVPVTFFYQLGMIYFFFSFLKTGKWPHLIGIILFLVPAMGRQTTPVILTTIMILSTFNQADRIKILSIRNFLSILVLMACFYLMTLSPITSSGSVVSVFPDAARVLAFIYERFLYYGAILTSGIAGVIMISGFTIGVMHHLGKWAKRRFPSLASRGWVWPLVTLAMIASMVSLKTVALYWLPATIVFLFLFDRELRLPLGWAGASLCSFLSANYYHNGYLLEAGFPLSLALGVIVYRAVAPCGQLFSAITRRVTRPALAVAAVCALLVCLVGIGAASRSGLLQKQFEVLDVVRVGADSNRNFKKLMDYLQQKAPRNALVYELSEEEIGTTLFDRRFFPLKERALRTKIMNIEDTLVMLKVLGRADIQLYPSAQLDPSAQSGEKYFISLNNFERGLAEARFPLELVAEFGADMDSAAVYRVKAPEGTGSGGRS